MRLLAGLLDEIALEKPVKNQDTHDSGG